MDKPQLTKMKRVKKSKLSPYEIKLADGRIVSKFFLHTYTSTKHTDTEMMHQNVPEFKQFHTDNDLNVVDQDREKEVYVVDNSAPVICMDPETKDNLTVANVRKVENKVHPDNYVNDVNHVREKKIETKTLPFGSESKHQSIHHLFDNSDDEIFKDMEMDYSSEKQIYEINDDDAATNAVKPYFDTQAKDISVGNILKDDCVKDAPNAPIPPLDPQTDVDVPTNTEEIDFWQDNDDEELIAAMANY